jgi:DNA-binding transcriptional MerR regulator
MNGQAARGYLSISEVLAHLRPDFPDISTSKIRFLETEGLIEPARSPSGYRRFVPADVARLRYILAAQRDQYLPLKVIKERLDGTGAGQGGAAAVVELPRARPAGPIGRRELIAATGVSDAMLTELESHGLLRRQGRQYPPDAIEITGAVQALAGYGVEARHLRAMRAAAERETALIEHLLAPVQRQRGGGGREQASQTAGELAGLLVRLHAALVGSELAEAGLAPAMAAADPAETRSAGPGAAAGVPGETGPAEAGPDMTATAAADGRIDAGRADAARDSGCTLTKGMPASTRGMPVREVGW